MFLATRGSKGEFRSTRGGEITLLPLRQRGSGEGGKGETVDAEALLSFAENMETIQKREENLMMHVRENFQSDF